MPGEGLLVGIATVAVVVAGFAAIAPGQSSDGWSATHRFRVRAIVSTSFNVTFESLAPAVLYPALADGRAALVLSSALASVYLVFVVVVRARQLMRTGALRVRWAQAAFMAGPVAVALFGLNALVYGSLTVYAIALCVQLSVSAISFYSLLAGSDTTAR